jgi:hypothetical protein
VVRNPKNLTLERAAERLDLAVDRQEAIDSIRRGESARVELEEHFRMKKNLLAEVSELIESFKRKSADGHCPAEATSEFEATINLKMQQYNDHEDRVRDQYQRLAATAMLGDMASHRLKELNK